MVAHVERHRQIERNLVLDRMKELPLADAVFLIVHYNAHYRIMGLAPYCQPILISELTIPVAAHEVDKWMLRASKLRNEAFNAGEALLLKDDSFEWLRAKLEADNPGFGRETYIAAIGYGVFQSRIVYAPSQ